MLAISASNAPPACMHACLHACLPLSESLKDSRPSHVLKPCLGALEYRYEVFAATGVARGCRTVKFGAGSLVGMLRHESGGAGGDFGACGSSTRPLVYQAATCSPQLTLVAYSYFHAPRAPALITRRLRPPAPQPSLLTCSTFLPCQYSDFRGQYSSGSLHTA